MSKKKVTAKPPVKQGTEDILHYTVETLEITIRSARRCAYDLVHCADALMMRKLNSASDHEFAKMFRERAEHFVKLFQSGNSMKDYRLKLHQDISDLEDRIEKYKAILAEHKIDDPFPF